MGNVIYSTLKHPKDSLRYIFVKPSTQGSVVRVIFVVPIILLIVAVVNFFFPLFSSKNHLSPFLFLLNGAPGLEGGG